MQHDEEKCRDCGGFVVGRDAIAAMSNGKCAHCQRKNTKKKSPEQRMKEKAHRDAKLAERAMYNQGRKHKK